jgi:hypothetical protein
MLKFQIDTLDGVDTALHNLYDKADDGYRLKVEGIEDTNGLKTALQKERENVKLTQKELNELKKLREEDELKILETQGKFKELSESEKTRRLETEQKFNELQKEIGQKTASLMVRELAQSLTTDPLELDIISKFAFDEVEIEGREAKFKKSIEDLKTDLSRFVRSKASGTNDGGNNNGGGATATVTREQFDLMSPDAKSKFAKDGGKIK